ncbi:MAG: Mrp/NBP35 family ATP-binding protein [Pseudobdellovibrionaceae bacterium]
MATMNPFEQQKPIPGIKNIIAVASGKGGVGKSTVAANLAYCLSKQFKVGILDADIYGPSQPRLFGALHQKPEITSEQKLIPINRHGVKMMSIGFLIADATAVVWRGPMLFKAMDQFFRDVEWGELDYLIIDLPPGTGDVQLSLVQKVPVTGAVIVTTPQNMSLIDVKRSIDMFQRVQVPLIGIVENMSYFRVPGTNEKMEMFPKGDLEKFILENQIPKLSEIAFSPSLSMTSEAGIPLAESHPEAPESLAFQKIADQVAKYGH